MTFSNVLFSYIDVTQFIAPQANFTVVLYLDGNI